MAGSKKALGILFGVKGGRNINGESGALILSDLTKIVNQINNNKKLLPGIKLTVDTKDALNSVKKLKNELIGISKLAGSIRAPGVSNQSGKAVGNGSSGKSSTTSKANVEYRTLIATVREYTKARLDAEKLVGKTGGAVSFNEDKTAISAAKGAAENYKAEIEQINDALQRYSALAIQDVSTFGNDEQAIEEYASSIGLTASQYSILCDKINASNVKVSVGTEKASRDSAAAWSKNSRNIRETVLRMYDTISKKPAVKKMADDILDMTSKSSGNLDDLKNKFDQFSNAAHESGADIETWGDKFSKTFGGKVRSVLAGAITGAVTKYLNQIYQNVVRLDKAMTDLQIASGKTRTELKALMNDYAELGRQIGASVTDIASGADTWLRQGYSETDSATLIKNTMMLSKLGKVESAEAAKYLTSAMKGYNIAVEDSVAIVDKWTAVDMEAAASAGDMATAMAETATSARIAGVDMDTLIGYIATVKEVTQDGAESVGKQNCLTIQ